MKFQEKKRLQVQLNALSGSAREELKKRAEAERKEIMRQRKGSVSLDEAMQYLLDRARAVPGGTTLSSAEIACTGLVVGLSRSRGCIECDGTEISAPLAPALAQMQRSAIAIGDIAQLGGDPLQVLAVLPRRTRLSRPHPGSPHIERVLAANIDVVGLVTSVAFPQMHIPLLDRALLAIEHGGAAPVIIATKIDQLTSEERERELARLQRYQEQGIPILPCSSATGEGLPALRTALAGRTCVLVGHSGVGKSTLLNALDTTLALATGALHKGSGSGRHTTTASRLYRLDGDIRLIDTPGVRAFGIWKMTKEEIYSYFEDFAELAIDCGFSNCSHTHEPRCAVKTAVETGAVRPARYAAYLRIMSDEDDGK